MNEQQQEQAQAAANAAAAAAAAQADLDAAAAAAAAQQQAPPHGQGGGAAGAAAPANAGALAQQVQALLIANAALQAQLNQQNAPPVAAAVGAAGAGIIVADTPGSYDVNSPLDYSSKVGISIYNQATKPLTTRFGMTPEEVVIFLQEFKDRADANGWSKGTYNVTKFLTNNNVSVHIHEGYGLLEAAAISNQCEIFVDPAGAHYNSRARQNNLMMVTCIMATLTDDARARLQPYASEYTRHNVVVGPLLFKTVMRLATIDSVATEESLRAKLRELHQLTSSLKYELPKIHALFHQYYTQLIARGASIDDPIGILFQIYLTINCTNFRNYIQRKHDMYYDGETPTLTHETLMASATDKYNYLVNKGQWCQETDTHVVALAAEVEKLKGQLKLAPALKKHASPDWRKMDGKGNVKPKVGTKTKNKKNNRDRREQVRDEAWKKTAPAEGEPSTKKVKDKTYHWCIHHMAWTIHTSSECRLGSTRVNAQNTRIVAHHATTAIASNRVPTPTHESYAAAIISNMARMAMDE
jgi:hypothetical protein